MEAASKAVDRACIFLLDDRLNLQCSNGVWVAQVDVVLVEPQEEDIWVALVRRVRCPFHFSFGADETLPKFFREARHGNNSSVRGSSILLKPLFPSSRSSRSPENCSKTGMLRSFVTVLRYPDHLQGKIILWCHASRWWPMSCTFLIAQSIQRLCECSHLPNSVLGVNITNQEKVGFFRKPDIIQEFFLMVDF